MIRILSIDDCVVNRAMVKAVLQPEEDIDIVADAENGRVALELIEDVQPDLILLDLEMPEMSGTEVIERLSQTHPDLPIIVLTKRTLDEFDGTVEALLRGATDFVEKPTGPGPLRKALLPRIRAIFEAKTHRPTGVVPIVAETPKRNAPVGLVAIGTSTGGPNALAEVIPRLPAEFPVPVVIVQHMPPVFTRDLANRLDRESRLRVVEAAEGDDLEPGCAYIAPGDYHMELQRLPGRATVSIRLNQGPKEHSCRPAVDPLFRSVTRLYRERALGVILTGMGADGTAGCRALRSAGAEVIAQDEATSVVWGMPGFVVESGLAQAVLPIDRVGAEITRRVMAGVTRPKARQAKAG